MGASPPRSPSTSAFPTSRRCSTRRGRSTGTWTAPSICSRSGARSGAIEGLRLEVVRLEGRTPVIFMEVPGAGPTTPCSSTVTRQAAGDDRLGRRARAVGAGAQGRQPLRPRRRATTATRPSLRSPRSRRCRRQRVPHARCVVLIEACEESGSYDLPFYIDALAARIGTPSLVVCLDSGCGNYDQLWCTTSLRGIVGGDAARRGADRGRALRRRPAASCPELPRRCASCSPAWRTRSRARSCRATST